MGSKHAFRLLVTLACLVSQGCSSVGSARKADEPGRPVATTNDAERHADLERELGLYSD